LSRREFLQGTAVGLALSGLAGAATGADSRVEKLSAVRAITRGPKFHWFSYYDKLQFDPSCRYVLGMEVDFEHRSPKPDDVIKVGMVDLNNGDRWKEVIWNDRQDDRFVCHILDVHSGRKRTLPHPVYTLSPDGSTAVAPDFRRVQDMRPGYGYAGLPDPHADDPAPKDSGIFRLDLETGKQELIISIAKVISISFPFASIIGKHYINHLLFNTDGSRFIFLHRWRTKGQKGFGTHMLTAKSDGTDIRVVDPHGKTSHFIWRDPKHILAWAWHPSHGNAFYLYEDRTGKVEVIGKGIMTKNGHCTYLPGNKWILNDTYPDRERKQNPYLYDVATGQTVPLGHFYSPPKYTGEWRCDTHPRFSPDGRSVVIDSPHGSNGRQMYLIDIGGIVS
ncbi:MAG: twin-arginine translocation signal domain-containing protein, partial [Planctomycetota bacterium]